MALCAGPAPAAGAGSCVDALAPARQPLAALRVLPALDAGAAPRRLHVRLQVFDRELVLLLVRDAGAGGETTAARQEPRPPTLLAGAGKYRGRVRGDRRSSVRVAISDGTLDGVIAFRDGVIFVEPAVRYCADATGLTVASRLSSAGAPTDAPHAPSGRWRAGRPDSLAPPGPGASRLPGREGNVPLPLPAPTPTPSGAGNPIALAAASPIVNRQALAAIGQENLVYNTLNQATAASLFFAQGLARDRSVAHTRLYIADANNSRVLGLECAGANCGLATGAAAVRVFGHPDFSGWATNGGLAASISATTLSFPFGIATDASGTLYVADTGNNRVLVYFNPWNDATADVVLGQPSMTTFAAGTSLAQLNSPRGVFVDGTGAVWVADTLNNRVLKFTNIANGASAALVVGGGGGPSPTTLSAPRDAAVDGAGNLYVADAGFNRVLRYSAPITNGKAAGAVFGQGGNLGSGAANLGGISANSLAGPEKVHLDANGRLWVADTQNNRVLEFDAPLSSTTAARVFGQVDRNQVPSFATNLPDGPDGLVNAAAFHHPRGVLTDGGGRLWVSDYESSRVLGFDNPLGSPPDALVADRVLSKDRLIDPHANRPTANRMNNAFGVAVDRSQTPNRLWVTDLGNSRVLGYSSTANISNDMDANLVLGQVDMVHGSPRRGLNGPLANAVTAVTSNAGFAGPSAVAVDSLGGVYVADISNSRILQFNNPFATDTNGDHVFGQVNFTNINPQFPLGTASALIGPTGVAIDAADNLWVADSNNHRVMRWSNAPAKPATGSSADLIIGQAAFQSSNTYPVYAPGCTVNRLNYPGGVYVGPSGRLYVADFNNHRVMVFTPPFSNGMNASAVFGQANFTSCLANRGGAPSNLTLFNPKDIFEDPAGNVYIADFGNNRTLVYHTPFAGGDLAADEVLGQPAFNTNGTGAPRPDTLINPAAVDMDSTGRLYIADVEESRVTQYATNSPPEVRLDPIPWPLIVGEHFAVSGTGFTPGSRLVVFVAMPGGVQAFTLTPDGQTTGFLITYIDPTIPLGNGFCSVVVVNTDQNFIQSNAQATYIHGSEIWNIPTILSINGVELRDFDENVPVASVETAVPKPSRATIGGTGFNNPLVNLFTPTSAFLLVPVAGGTATQIQVDVPGNVPTGPGAFQVINNPFGANNASNAVSVPVGAPLTITGIGQSGNTVTINGTGFSVASVINFFNRQGNSVVNLGGYGANGPNVPLTLVSDTQLTFTKPGAAVPGPSYIQVLNPPFIPFSSTGGDPDGAFTLQ